MISVGPLVAGERARWTELWRAYLAFYGTELPDATYEATWVRLMQDTALHGLAARVDGEVVGITHFLFHTSAWTTAPICYLQDLFVTAASRGHGAGRALIEAVAERARARASGRLYWLTQADNTTARALYDRLARHSGFIRYEYDLG
ncbi:MAG: GNAT family N-acetyltransferase [Acetobacteraceae bacterium]